MMQTSVVPGIAAHSGWLELGLAFDILVLGLIFSALLLTFIVAILYPHPARMTALGLLC